MVYVRILFTGCYIDSAHCDERTGGDMGRSVFSVIRCCMNDENVVRKRAQTILRDGINKYFNHFCVSYDLSFGICHNV
jgi:hypothetical protein